MSSACSRWLCFLLALYYSLGCVVVVEGFQSSSAFPNAAYRVHRFPTALLSRPNHDGDDISQQSPQKLAPQTMPRQRRLAVLQQQEWLPLPAQHLLLLPLLVVLLLTQQPSPALAGEVGARITKAVTTSDLGIAVRRSVVKGAQVMDRVDGQWEQFSDQFGLGLERSNRDNKPAPKVIPPPRPLDKELARELLERTDRAFWSTITTTTTRTGVAANELERRIEKVTTIVRPSFERSGLTNNNNINSEEEDRSTASLTLKGGSSMDDKDGGAQFNFRSYTHFKAYLEILMERNDVNFPQFRKQFETKVGRDVVELLLPDTKTLSRNTAAGVPSSPRERRQALQEALDVIEQLSQALVDRGLVAQIDTANPLVNIPEDVNDWSEDLQDLNWSIALDGDITLGSQLLLQEQGLRLYPSFARCAIQYVLEEVMLGQKVSLDEYYMDTDYNSDPDKFEVKEVLVNIVLESV